MTRGAPSTVYVVMLDDCRPTKTEDLACAIVAARSENPTVASAWMHLNVAVRLAEASALEATTNKLVQDADDFRARREKIMFAAQSALKNTQNQLLQDAGHLRTHPKEIASLDAPVPPTTTASKYGRTMSGQRKAQLDRRIRIEPVKERPQPQKTTLFEVFRAVRRIWIGK